MVHLLAPVIFLSAGWVELTCCIVTGARASTGVGWGPGKESRRGHIEMSSLSGISAQIKFFVSIKAKNVRERWGKGLKSRDFPFPHERKQTMKFCASSIFCFLTLTSQTCSFVFFSIYSLFIKIVEKIKQLRRFSSTNQSESSKLYSSMSGTLKMQDCDN